MSSLLWCFTVCMCVCLLVHPCGKVYFYTSFSYLLITPDISERRGIKPDAELLPVQLIYSLIIMMSWVSHTSVQMQTNPALVRIALKGRFPHPLGGNNCPTHRLSRFSSFSQLSHRNPAHLPSWWLKWILPAMHAYISHTFPFKSLTLTERLPVTAASPQLCGCW